MAVRFKEGVTCERVEDEGIIVDAYGGRYIDLNRSALEMVFALCEEPDQQSAVDRLLHLFDADRETLSKDLQNMLDRLRALGLTADDS